MLMLVLQTEREFIRQRQREGSDAAKARDVRRGRQAMVLPKTMKPVSFNGRTGREALRLLGVTHKKFQR